MTLANQPMMIPRDFQRLRVQPLNNLQRKVAMYPKPQNATNPGYFLTIDFDGFPHMDTRSIPYYPKVGAVIQIPSHVIINPRRACAARVTVLCLFVTVCVCVSDTTLQASVVEGTLNFGHQRSVNDTLQRFDSWILRTMLGSRVMAKFVSKEAYDRSHTLL